MLRPVEPSGVAGAEMTRRDWAGLVQLAWLAESTWLTLPDFFNCANDFINPIHRRV